MSPHEFDLVVLVVGALLITAVAAVRASTRLGVPSLLCYLALGVALGESGAGVEFDDAQLAQHLGLAALVVILAEGGLTAHWPSLRPVLPVGLALSTVGVAVSVLVTAAGVHLLLGLEWRVALILGGVVAPTDAAAIFATLRGMPLRRSLVNVLEVESGTNDPLAVIIVVALSSRTPAGGAWHTVAEGIVEIVVGALVGVALGHLGGRVLRAAALPAAGLYPLGVLATAVLAYGVAAVLHGSGFLAVYVAAVSLGRLRLPHQQATRAVIEGIGWLAQIGLFVMLGLLVSPGRLGAAAATALVASGVLLLVARPLAVAAAVGWVLPVRHQAFLSWAGLRGAVPIVLATIPVTAAVPGSDDLIEVVFFLTVVLTLVQGSTLPAVARRLGAVDDAALTDLQVESAPLEALGADLLQMRIPAGSRLHGVEIDALRLPAGALITLVVRAGRSFVPGPSTSLRAGDQVVVVATEQSRPEAERRLRAVSRRGDLARWHGERGEE
ncbi:MAG TPA: potassium/proton antiporter [Mycobacteriales bacterium]|nr:potassium/proton antiporter [Mycobacteriales bacterium]